MSEKPHVTVVLGPTASGKTDYAIGLAQERSGAVISADSRQVYTGMNIGTATPLRHGSLPVRQAGAGQEPHDILVSDAVAGIPHYLFNIREPNNPITLPEWQAAAYQVLEHLHQANTAAIVTGGTMLYIDSLLFNYDIPQVQPNETLRAELEAKSVEELYTQLQQKDPAATAFIEPRNKRRIIRALEVMAGSHKTFSELRKKREPLYTFEVIGIQVEWDELTQRITKRAQTMLENGLIEETQALRDQYGKDLALLQTMNYREVGALLDGTMNKKEALDAMIRANVRYARRQMRWWRGRSDIRWVTPHSR